MRNPFRRKPRHEPNRILNPGGGPVHVANTKDLRGDERVDVGDGRTVLLADLLAGLDEIPVSGPEVGR